MTPDPTPYEPPYVTRRRCVVCRASLVGRNWNTRTCSDRCRQRLHRSKETR